MQEPQTVKRYMAITKLANNAAGVIHFDTFAEMDSLVPDDDWPMLMVCHAEEAPYFMQMLGTQGVEDWYTPDPNER